MDSFEVERSETVTRTEAATRLRRIATLLSSGEDEVEFEMDEKEHELEIELKW